MAKGGFRGGMPGGMNQAAMMKQAQKLQQQMLQMQQEQESKTHTAQSGGGMVTATVNGKHELVNLEIKPEAAATRFKMKDTSLRGAALLEEACRGRGWLMPGGVMDTDRGAAVILDEFRAGKLGRLTLQRAPEKKVVKAEAPAAQVKTEAADAAE